MQTSYHYNATFSDKDWQTDTIRVADMRMASLEQDPPDSVLMADAFSDPVGGSGNSSFDRGVGQHHGDGYNILKIDGSATFFHDPGNTVRDLKGGTNYHATQGDYERHQARAWRIFAGWE